MRFFRPLQIHSARGFAERYATIAERKTQGVFAYHLRFIVSFARSAKGEFREKSAIRDPQSAIPS